MSATRSRLALALAAGAFLPAALYAQQSTGSLSGRITAADGATPKAGVVVTVIQKGTNLTRKTTTDAEGNWRAPALPVGDYKILLAYGGQPPQVINRAVNLGMDTLVRFKWPSDAGATVVVEAAATGVDQVNTSSAEIGVNVDSQVLTSLPVIDRNVNSAAVLAPGVSIISGSQVDPTKKTSTYIVSGDGQGRGTNFNVDGADNNSSDVGGYVLPVPMDAIDQFQVVTNQYKAEFGRSNAGFLNVVTKSGTNDFHGTVNYQFTNQSMRARRTDETPKLDNDESQYSVEAAGPIIKDNLFFMIAGEKTKASQGQTFAPRAVTVYPELGGEKNTLEKMNLYTKVDWIISQTWLASVKYARYYDTSANQTFPHTDAVAGYVSPSMLGTNRDNTTSYGAKLTGTFGNLVWESTFNTFDYANSIRPSNPGPNNGTGLELRNRHVASIDLWRQGQDPNSYQNTGVKRSQWKNEVTWTLPEHNLKGGVDYQKTKYPLEQYFYAEPTIYVMGVEESQGITFSNAWSQNVTPAMLSRVLPSTPIINPPTDFENWGLYAQDDWTINPKWSVYYGVRMDWDTQLDYYKQFDGLYHQMHQANPLLAGIGDEAPRTHHYLSPRLQVLYKPNGDDNLTFKFGYGKFVASTIDNVVGYSRALNAKVNGLPASYINNNGSNFLAGATLLQVGGTNIILPADLTPYNYANNVGANSGIAQADGHVYGLRDLFGTYVNSLLTTANNSTGGKQMLASNFAYPTTQTLTLGVTYKFNERSAIDLTLLYSKTKNLTVQYTTDGSTPFAWSPTPATAGTPFSFDRYMQYQANYEDNPDLGDNIFMSNQTSSQKQLQVKYTYTTSKMQFLTTFVAKEMKSGTGGDGGAFMSGGSADFYGYANLTPWETRPEHTSNGTEALSGSFAWSYQFDTETQIGLLGQWHSGKYYDTFQGYAPDNGTMVPIKPADGPEYPMYGGSGATDLANPNPWVGTATGDWNLTMDLRISQKLHFRSLTFEPYLVVHNLLNNYDYGTNYDPNVATSDGYNFNFGKRLPNFQANSPRTAAVGLRMTW